MSSRRVSFEQLEVMWEFLNAHKDIAVCYNKSAQARATSRRMWTELVESLNAVVGGAIKDWKNWSNYWVDYKGKLKRKCANLRASHSRTGGGPSTVPELSEIELKFLSILGDDLGSGLPGIQVALNITSYATSNEPMAHSMDTEIFPPMAVTPDLETDAGPSLIPLQDQPPTQLNTSQPITQPTEPISQPNVTVERIVSRQPLRRRNRPTQMSQEAARRILAETSRVRAEATQDIANRLRNIESCLLSISDTLANMYQRSFGMPTNDQ